MQNADNVNYQYIMKVKTDIETARNIIKTLKVGKSINVKVASLTNFRSYLSYLNTENKKFNTINTGNEVFVMRLN